MIGGPPIFFPPHMAAPQAYPPQYAQPAAPTWQGQPRPQTYAQAPAAPKARPAAVPAPRIRAQQPDEPRSNDLAPIEARPAPLSIPSAQQLGLTTVQHAVAATPATDWSAVHAKLDRLGATGFHLHKPTEGGCRITCLLPTAQPERAHRIDVQAGSEAEAVRLAVQKAEEWAAQPRR